MTEIFVAYQGEYSDRRATGVFSTREKAKAASDGDDYNVECWFLDNDPDHADGLKYYFIQMRRNGDVRTCEEIPYGGREQPPVIISRRNSAAAPEWGDCWFHYFARSGQHACKSANERRVQMIANNEWPETK